MVQKTRVGLGGRFAWTSTGNEDVQVKRVPTRPLGKLPKRLSHKFMTVAD